MERVLRRLLRIWIPDATGGVLHTSATAAEALAHKTATAIAAAAAAAKNNAGTVAGGDGSLGEGGGEGGETPGLELTKLVRRPLASNVDDTEESEKDDRDLAAILAAPSSELRAILLDAPASPISSTASSDEQTDLGCVVYYGEYVSTVYPTVDACFPKAADVKEQVPPPPTHHICLT